MRVYSANPQEAREVLRLTLATGRQSAAELEAQVTVFIQYTRALGLALDEHWWCEADGRRCCACTCITSPGRTGMLVFPTSSLSGLQEAELAEFIGAVVEAKSGSNLALLQCLTQPEDTILTQSLRRAGFRDISLLEYLDADLSSAATLQWLDSARPEQPLLGTILTYSEATHQPLADLIAATYQGSLDCPFLTDLRPMDDVIAGHQSAGRFDPRRWLIFLDSSGPAGCILLNENPLHPVLEVVYMGVHPRLRRCGLGRRLLTEAFQLAHREDITRVTLAVDACNDPARRLYAAAGFHEVMRRRAMVRVFPASSFQPST